MNKEFIYLKGNPVAGYSGFIVYSPWGGSPSSSYWMIPGTWEYDWDNQ